MTGRFDLVLNGVSAVIKPDDVAKVAALPGVEAVYPDVILQLDTDATPSFIGATSAWATLGGQEKAGEGVIVGVLDTGIWPEHPVVLRPRSSRQALCGSDARAGRVARLRVQRRRQPGPRVHVQQQAHRGGPLHGHVRRGRRPPAG